MYMAYINNCDEDSRELVWCIEKDMLDVVACKETEERYVAEDVEKQGYRPLNMFGYDIQSYILHDSQRKMMTHLANDLKPDDYDIKDDVKEEG